jgi:hypothetical protein
MTTEQRQTIREALERCLVEHNHLMAEADFPLGSPKIDAAIAILDADETPSAAQDVRELIDRLDDIRDKYTDDELKWLSFDHIEAYIVEATAEIECFAAARVLTKAQGKDAYFINEVIPNIKSAQEAERLARAPSPIIGKANSPIGIEPAWINFENEDFTWDDLAKYLVRRFQVADIEELIYLLQNNCPQAEERAPSPSGEMLREVADELYYEAHNTPRTSYLVSAQAKLAALFFSPQSTEETK